MKEYTYTNKAYLGIKEGVVPPAPQYLWLNSKDNKLYKFGDNGWVSISGAEFSVMGEYDKEKTYYPNSIVTYNGSSYISLISVPTYEYPTQNSDYWNLLAQKGEQGPQGNSGYSGNIDELEVVNNLIDGGENSALSAEQGKILKEELNECVTTIEVPQIIEENTLSALDETSKKPVNSIGITEAIKVESNNLKERGYIYKGGATPVTNPEIPDGPVFYIATQAGVYVNFNGITLDKGESAVIEWNSGSWSKKTISSSESLGIFGDARLNALVKNFYYKTNANAPDYTKVGRVLIQIAKFGRNSQKYFNSIYIYDKDTGQAIGGAEKTFQTEEEALAAWNTGHYETSNIVINTVPVEKPWSISIVTNVNHPLTAQYAFTPISLYNEQVPNCVAQIDALMAYRATAEQRKLTVEKSVNMFNADTVKDGYLVGNKVYDSTTYKYSAPIFVRGGVRYKQTKSSGFGSSLYYHVVSPDGKYLSYGNPEEIGDFWYYIFPEDCYISINAGTLYSKVVFAEESLFPDVYIGYEEVLPHAKIHAENIIGEKIASVLEGKILSVNGDSICAGAGSSGGYAKIIGEKYNMTVQNIGVGGATITAETKSGDANRHWICRTISSMREDADYAIVEGGVNDGSLYIPMGALSRGYDAELDDTTFYGAFESMLKQMIIRFAGKKIGYIAVHKMTPSFSSTLRNEEENYYHAAKHCCEKWGVPFLDLNTTVPPFEYFTGIEGLDSVTSAYTHDGDGWHPNEEGYKKYYCDKIAAWMGTL